MKIKYPTEQTTSPPAFSSLFWLCRRTEAEKGSVPLQHTFDCGDYDIPFDGISAVLLGT